ncbi:competence/damage-inducible protein A [Peptoniphilus stercorisuis]|uniref:Putative competence-damage inducible protein n=1 Tax=Peptoniphilus stercorisuis TaxID=1436965 RepID=A0ABS4KFT5_9FIRM|nr:competence/damage-inducible protein A [Peptoniphilus stercorisuis]MBP2025504.1 nicotinamide-nucleotide amidase [Peptoniphilus stercorisuis]
MKAEILTIGTEVLIGSILNTNAKFLSEKLSEIGVNVEYQISVKDDYDKIYDQINRSIERSDLIFLCGGLGPTEDDITKDVLADVLNKKLYIDKKEEENLLEFYKNSNKTMTKNNIRQVRVIEGSKVFHNHWGIAPGELIELDSKKIFLLPGPPKEFEPMVNKYVLNNIYEDNDIEILSINIIGLGESNIEDRIRKLNINYNNVTINTFAHFYDTEVKIIAEGLNSELLKEEISKIEYLIRKEFGKNVYSTGLTTPCETLVKKLIDKNIKISFAESITGGLLSSKITSVPNSSKILKSSYVTYSNEAKIFELNVREETLNEFGAVSEETAIEMARGLYNKGFSNIAISITGEAGPTPTEKEVGQVFICFYEGEDNYFIKDIKFHGNRNEIQERAANYIITKLLLKIN